MHLFTHSLTCMQEGLYFFEAAFRIHGVDYESVYPRLAAARCDHRYFVPLANLNVAETTLTKDL